MSLPSNSRDLIKVDEKKSNLPIKFNPNEINQALQLVDKDLFLKNREDVKKYLPDILGRVLARIWIDKTFKEDFKSILTCFKWKWCFFTRWHDFRISKAKLW